MKPFVLGKMLARLLVLFLSLNNYASAIYLLYLTGQHDIVPEASLVANVTHVCLAFMSSAIFNEPSQTSWPLFTTVDKVRSQFSLGTNILVSIGGWGDTAGFSVAAATKHSRELFAKNVKAMVDTTGADGVDVDWEYPGGNGEDYKQTPNSQKAWEIEAYPQLLSAIRSALGTKKLMTAAVPGLPRDMLGFNKITIAEIDASLDFFNVMTYDLMNRRDTITKHHTGIELSIDSINAYEDLGISPKKLNLGFAFYVRWFKTDPNGGCDQNPIGCKAALMEDPTTGADLGQSGAFSWHDSVPGELQTSYERALVHGKYDEYNGGHYYWDPYENIWWTWDTPDVILRKFPAIVKPKRLGGVFAWALGEDAPAFVHLKALTSGVNTLLETHPSEEPHVSPMSVSSSQRSDEL